MLYHQKVKRKKLGEKNYSFVDVLKVTNGKSRGSGYKSADPDPHQHVVKDPEHWYKLSATVIVEREKKYNSEDELGQQEYS
jgi:hypothetical protein